MGVFRQITPEHRKAFDFLRNELKDERKVSVVELKQKAKAARVSRESLAAARKLLKVQVSRIGGMHGAFFWQMPPS